MEDQVTLHVEHPVFHAVLLLIFSFLACIAVASRLWARRIQNLALALSDFVIILGLVSKSKAGEIDCVVNTNRFSHWLNRVLISMVCCLGWNWFFLWCTC